MSGSLAEAVVIEKVKVVVEEARARDGLRLRFGGRLRLRLGFGGGLLP